MTDKTDKTEPHISDFQGWRTNLSEGLEAYAEKNVASKTVYTFLDDAIRNEAVGPVDPISTYPNRQRLNYATMALNYANVPHSNKLAEAAVRLTMGVNDKDALTKSLRGTLKAAMPTEYINQIAGEISDRIAAVENLVAGITDAWNSAGPQTAENKVAQAKLDIKLIATLLTTITDLIDKLAGASKSKDAGPTNVKSAIDVVMSILDILSQLISYIEMVADKLTPEEYDRLMKLVAELDKNKESSNVPGSKEMLTRALIAALEMIKPYITNLILMLLLECFTAIMDVIKKIPGAGGVFPPPLDMIPPMVSLVGTVIRGDLGALTRRLWNDMQILLDFVRASAEIACTSDASLDKAERAIAEAEATTSSTIETPTNETLKTLAAIEAKKTNNHRLESATADTITTSITTVLTNAIATTAAAHTTELVALAEVEVAAKAEADGAAAESNAGKQTLANNIVRGNYIIIK